MIVDINIFLKGRMGIAANSANLVAFCYKEFDKFMLYKSFKQLEAIFVYSEPIARLYANIQFS